MNNNNNNLDKLLEPFATPLTDLEPGRQELPGMKKYLTGFAVGSLAGLNGTILTTMICGFNYQSTDIGVVISSGLSGLLVTYCGMDLNFDVL